MPRSRKSQRAKREQEVNWGVLPAKREDGTLDLTPHIASLNIVTRGRYLRLGNGFIVKQRY